jgi:hypothetical protein
MPEIGKDLKIPLDILKEFGGSTRIIEKLKWRGMWPIDARIRQQIEAQIPQIRSNEMVSKQFEYALVYKGKNLEEDMKALGISNVNPLIVKKWLIGIPVPWRYLLKMKIDYQKFDVVLTPKM